MEFANYFNPFDTNALFGHLSNNCLSKKTVFNSNPDQSALGEFDIAIIGIQDERNAPEKGICKAADLIRKKLYPLRRDDKQIRIVDLGNLKNGNRVNDTYYALRDITTYLLKEKVIPIIIGGATDMSYPVYLAIEQLKSNINVVSIAPSLVLENNDGLNASNAYLNIIKSHKKTLLNFTNIGYQSYLSDTNALDLLHAHFFDAIRLGIAKSNIANNEPYIRDADFVSFDIGAIKQADAPAHHAPSPNGFDANEACQLSWYSGISDKVSIFGIHNLNPLFDSHSQTSHLAAQMIWYFIEGYYNRNHEYPIGKIETYKNYIVYLDEIKRELIFYKSQKSGRWWIEVPCGKTDNNKKIYIACSEKDYETAAQQEIPDRWWRYFSKLNI